MDAQITKKNQSIPTSIEDLANELLSEIFVRLPCHESVISCKFVSKRWLFVLSNPKFVVRFLNHKKFQIESKKGKLPWSFLSTMKMKMNGNGNEDDENDRNEIPNDKVFNSPKFTLNFLPFPFKVAATFKDLILCTNLKANDDYDDNWHYYYIICNPVTKQWLAIPPTPTLSAPIDQRPLRSRSWASLICEDDVSYSVDLGRPHYKFRIVVIHPKPVDRPRVNHPSKVFNLMVFCSETFQWKRVDLSVAIKPSTAKHCPGVLRAPFLGVLCNGMVCVRHHPYFGMFNPFDVTPDTTTTHFEARMLPKYIVDAKDGKVLECGGSKLVVINQPWLSSSGLFTLRSFELDLKDINAVPELWDFKFRGKCIDNEGSMQLPTAMRKIIGIHPSNRQLLYVLTANYEVVLCDMGSKSLKVLGTLDPDHFVFNARLQLQPWPTPLPLSPLNDQ